MSWREFLEFAFTHQRSFFFLTAAECLIFAFVIFIPSYKKHFSGVRRWANFFAFTFLALALMYLIRYFNLKVQFPSDAQTEVARVLLSGFSNLFLFLTSIFIKKDFGKIKIFSREMAEELFRGWRAVGLALIILSSLCAVIAKISADSFYKTALEIPDRFVSSFVLFWFGLVILRELTFRRSSILATIALFSLFAYALIFAFQAVHLIDLNAGNSWELPPGRVAAAITFISFFLKAALFFPTYFLITSTSNEYRGIHELLEEVTTDRVEFLESEGILKKIIEILKADAIKLTIMLPGKTRSMISSYQYPATERYKLDPQKKPEITMRDKATRGFERSVCEQVFNDNKVLTHNVYNYEDNLNSILKSKFNGLAGKENISLIASPIRYHGAVIGSLEICLNNSPLKLWFSRTDVLQVQRIAVLLTRVVQANREVAGLDQLITRMGSLQTDFPELPSDKAIKEILEVLDDLFSPLAVGIHIDIGFKSKLHTLSKNNGYEQELRINLSHRTPKAINNSNVIAIYNDLIVPSFENFKYLRKEEDVLKSIKDRTFGQLVAVVPRHSDKFDSPTLFSYHLLCRVISNIIVDSYLDFARDYLNAQLKDLTVKLNAPENSNISTWFKIVEEKINEVGLLWAVVTRDISPDETIGENRELVNKLWENNHPDYENKIIGLYRVTSTVFKEANQVVRLKLENFKGALWLGVERKDFGAEIEKYRTSPWRTFLEGLADISDTALHRIIDEDKREQNAKEAAEFHGLATAAVTTGTLLHQIGNQVKEITFPVNTLKNALKLGKLRGTKEFWLSIYALIESASKLDELTQLLSGIVKVDGHRPSQLGEIIEESKKLFDGALDQYKIKFDNTLSAKFLSKEVDVPFYVGSFALTNLVINAKDSIKMSKTQNGLIIIDAEENENAVLFHVIDNGSGVPKEARDRIFEKGFTTKVDGTNVSTGLGLFFTQLSLRESGALVRLTNPGPEPPTKFTIYFPKPRKEKM